MAPFVTKNWWIALLALVVVVPALLVLTISRPPLDWSLLGPPRALPPPGDAGPPPEVQEIDVPRDVADALRKREDELVGPLRLVPAEENGKLVGVFLFGVHDGDPVTTLGLRNGDRLETINGLAVTPEMAPRLSEELRTQDRLSVRLRRRETELEIDYAIR